MAEKCARMFTERKLLDITSTEQCLATGIDEDGKKPRNLADQIARLLDDDSVVHEDRVRLLTMYILYRYGVLRGDIEKLRCHGELSPMDGEMIYNLDTLGARIERQLKDKAPAPEPLFQQKTPQVMPGDEIELSRFEPAMKLMLEALCRNTIDASIFPPVKPQLDHSSTAQSSTSLRMGGRAAPTWASSRQQSSKPRQRLIVFMAGGATYSEARSCYEISQQFGKEVFLATTHMLTPKTFTRQVSMLSRGRGELALPVDSGPPKLPAWMSEPPPGAAKPPTVQQPQTSNGRPAKVVSEPQPVPPTAQMQRMNLTPQPQSHSSGRPASSARPEPPKSTFKDPAQLAKEKEGKKDKKSHFNMFKKHS